MSWDPVGFGKWSGTDITLPQIVFRDPDWFFWACENGVLVARGISRAEEVFQKARHIRIRQRGPVRLVAEYVRHGPSGKFSHVELVEETVPQDEGSSYCWRRPVLDLAAPRELASYDKLGMATMVKAVKHHVFGRRVRLTRARCEEFFDDDSNFDLEGGIL